MALAEVCKTSKAPYMRWESWFANAADNEMKTQMCNMENPYILLAPPFEQPLENLYKMQVDGGKSGAKIDFDHGTTTLAFKYKGGVILPVDSRATGGQFIGSQNMQI